ncbi:hypothetical protein TELCIR_06062 [Teladorsagia circumcincta]|uniref:DNA polymerase delta catalytic subunit n=1 Tax=Teladorsagia circumcincta TaxID=45464 RepID=A0A2G9UP41_TELCI|nr:hypothetical protein TELCIR_06062 [Teladorsagia circumcincta]
MTSSSRVPSGIGCQLEVEVKLQDLIVHDPEGEWGAVALIRTLSFDIECMGCPGVFPDANEDPVIQIANMVKVEGESEPFIRNCFVLGTCAPVIGSDIIQCESEKDLLENEEIIHDAPQMKANNIFLPVIEVQGGDSEGYEGATVIEPLRGFYNEPIATLDFASLYPSIMIAHNLCYTTLLKKPEGEEGKLMLTLTYERCYLQRKSANVQSTCCF